MSCHCGGCTGACNCHNVACDMGFVARDVVRAISLVEHGPSFSNRAGGYTLYYRGKATAFAFTEAPDFMSRGRGQKKKTWAILNHDGSAHRQLTWFEDKRALAWPIAQQLTRIVEQLELDAVEREREYYATNQGERPLRHEVEHLRARVAVLEAEKEARAHPLKIRIRPRRKK